MNNAKIGAAVLGGYVLGRTKKGKLALSLGLLAGSRIKPGQLVKAVQKSPFLGDITRQVRTELTGAGKAAATSVLTAKADSLADAIHARTAGLHEKAHPDEEREDEDREKAQHRKSGQEEGEPRSRRTGGDTAAQSRPKSGSARSRRSDDG